VCLFGGKQTNQFFYVLRHCSNELLFFYLHNFCDSTMTGVAVDALAPKVVNFIAARLKMTAGT